MAAAFVLAKTGRDALFFMASGLRDLPKAYVAIAVLALPVAGSVLALMRTLGPRRARVAATLLMTVLLLSSGRIVTPGGGPIMTAIFVTVPLAFGVLFSMAWLLAADLLEGADRSTLTHAYAEIGAGSILGGVAGGLIAKVIAGRSEPHALLVAAAVEPAAGRLRCELDHLGAAGRGGGLDRPHARARPPSPFHRRDRGCRSRDPDPRQLNHHRHSRRGCPAERTGAEHEKRAGPR
jgi:hypothetical protein